MLSIHGPENRSRLLRQVAHGVADLPNRLLEVCNKARAMSTFYDHKIIRKILVLRTGAGQSWDPFRPVQKIQPAEVSGSASAASGISKAYARERSNKLVLQSRQSGAGPVEVPRASQAHDLQKEGQSAPAPRGSIHHSSTVNAAAVCRPLSSSATGQAATSVFTGRSGAEAQCARRLQTQALQGRQSVLHKQSQSGTARQPAKPHGKTWTRQPTPATVSHPGTPRLVQAVGPTREHKSAGSRGLQQRVQSPKFALRRVNQLVRVSSLASQKSAAQQSWLGKCLGTMLSTVRVAAQKHFAADKILVLFCCYRRQQICCTDNTEAF